MYRAEAMTTMRRLMRRRRRMIVTFVPSPAALAWVFVIAFATVIVC